MVISKIQEWYIHLLLTNYLVISRYFTNTFCVLKTFNLVFSYIDVWFTSQNSKPLEIEDKVTITLAIN